MIHYKNLILIGTSHIAKQSIEEVQESFEKYDPDIIALELDKTRFKGLITKKKSIKLKDIKKIGLKGMLFGMIVSWIENKIGNIVNVKPGSEMISAIKLSIKNKKQMMLIDQDIKITLKRISEELTWKEKWYFIIDTIFSLTHKNKIDLDLNKVPNKKIIKEMTNQLRERYPNIHKVLIIERNKVMAKNLNTILNNNPNKQVLAIVGAGHEEDIIEIIKHG